MLKFGYGLKDIIANYLNIRLAKKLGIITVVLDALKGVVVILAAMAMGFDEGVLWTIGVLSIVGHCFSPYLWFEGGKGVATGLGVLVLLTPLSAIVGLVVWFVVMVTVYSRGSALVIKNVKSPCLKYLPSKSLSLKPSCDNVVIVVKS